jgi:excinuclease ABC subunit A
MPDNHIRVRGARVHNLRNIDVDIPRDSLVVMSGVSGSGKSSLAFDTLFAEGQRRYLESLSTYTRQYLDQLQRPDADLIDGLPPTISIDQRSGSVRVRSTLATTTEIYDYLRLLYARAGQAHCPRCRQPVSCQSSQAIVEQILALEARRKVMILAPLVRGRKGTHRQVFEKICKDGFVRARVDGEVVDASDPPELAKNKRHDVEVLVDRILVKEGIRPRLQESIELALKQGQGTCLLSDYDGDRWHDRLYSEKFACPNCSISFPELEPRTFSFSSPYGACPECDGLGVQFSSAADEDSIRELESQVVCEACQGGRLNPFARAVTLAGRSIHELTAMCVSAAAAFFEGLMKSVGSDADDSVFMPEGRLVAAKTVPDVAARLRFLVDVGLGYLNLDRPTRTLSGGEFQRARLAACLGSGLIGVCYILDEPTIGLHPRDTARLIEILVELRDLGNSIVVVEHDPDMILRADYLIDLGPGAGREGGRIVAAGTPAEVAREPNSLTGNYLNNPAALCRPSKRRHIDWKRSLTLKGTRTHNLKNVTARVPLEVFTCVTGVSGSGKSSLITHTLTPSVRRALTNPTSQTGLFRPLDVDALDGVALIDRIVEIDQSPIGRTGRSNPATYSGIWDEVRKMFARTRAARLRGYPARRFSFNAPGGRCEACKGQGTQRIEMHFMPEMHVTCPDCQGSRFNRQTLAIRFAGKNVADILRLRIDEALEFFGNFPKLRAILDTFNDVGLGYLSLGQSSLTLSGGEAQRVKLATELSRCSDEKTLFVLDEPTTGLHPADIEKLMTLLGRLIDRGNSVLVVEHQIDVIASSDWLIDLGPEGGDAGGRIVAQGRPEDVANVEQSHTGRALRDYFQRTRESSLRG